MSKRVPLEGNRWVVCVTKETCYQSAGRIVIRRNNGLDDVEVIAGPFDSREQTSYARLQITKCTGCSKPFIPVSFSDSRTNKIVMGIMAHKKTHCIACLQRMQTEWTEARWAARQGIPTIL